MPYLGRRVVIGTFTLPDTNTNEVTLTFSSGVAGSSAAGYLRARSGNAAAVFVSTDNDASNEPRYRLGPGETFPIQLAYEDVELLYVDGSAADVIEFVADASE